MFSGFEWYLILSWLYPALVGIPHWIRRKPTVIKELIEVADIERVNYLYGQESRMQAPVYVGGQHLMAPVGGGLSVDWKRIYSEFVSARGPSYWNYHYPDGATALPEQIYLNSYNAFKKALPALPEERFPLSFPLKLESQRFSVPEKVLFHGRTGLADQAVRRETLVQAVLFKTRPIGFLTVPAVATVLFLGAWGLRIMEKSQFPTLAKYERDPTDFSGAVWRKLDR
jgi:hypothetical protein